ncbi:MAG: Gfo/Idh/MocA family protein [Phycisphaerales bacterium JB039]
MAELTVTRRALLASGAGLACAAVAPGAIGRILRPSAEVRLGVLGLRSRGRQLIDQILPEADARVLAVCDPDANILAREQQRIEEKTGKRPDGSADLRHLLDRADIDAIVIATPNHWHALATIWACQAGKDVYVEKPVSHNVWEGRQMVAAARKHGRIVQAGLQNRSDTGLRAFMDWFADEPLGKPLYAHAVWYRTREPIGRVTAPTPIPDHVDYDLMCGPRNVAPLLRRNLHYDWHWQWPWGSGEMGNVGVHVMDDARFMLGLGMPTRVCSAGGRFVWDDDGQTPNIMMAVFDFDGFPLIAGVRDLPVAAGSNDPCRLRGRTVTVIIQCENGYFSGSRGGGAAFDASGARIRDFPGDSGATHIRNFLDAIGSRRQSDLRCDIAEGAATSDLCHYANIAWRLGRNASPGEIRAELEPIPPAAEAFSDIPDLLRANNVDLDATPIRLGSWMGIDPETHDITSAESLQQARGMLREAYRAPFIVPEIV